MRVLVACEESQRVCIAFREKGHEAYSCDIQPCSGGHPEWHIQGDCLPLLKQDDRRCGNESNYPSRRVRESRRGIYLPKGGNSPSG